MFVTAASVSNGGPHDHAYRVLQHSNQVAKAPQEPEAAVQAKMAYNVTRPHCHGKLF
jgi:hypothetical protein